MRTVFHTMLLTTIVLLAAGCAKKDNSVAPDVEAPTIKINAPEAGDTVGVEKAWTDASVLDDIEVTSVTFLIDGNEVATMTAPPFRDSISIASLAYGPHTLLVRGVDGTGKVSERSVAFVKGVATGGAVRRFTLCEIVTSGNCFPCVGADSIYLFGLTTRNYPRLITIKYHAYFPPPPDSLWLYSKTICRPRLEYLFNPPGIAYASSPNAWVSGTKAGTIATNWLTLIEDDMKLPPEAKIEITKTDNGASVHLTIRVTGISSSAFTDLRLQTVITETDINYKGINGVPVHYDVMRTMLPGPEGEAMSLADNQAVTFERDVTIDPIWKNCTAVVFVQSNGSKHVLQAAALKLR